MTSAAKKLSSAQIDALHAAATGSLWRSPRGTFETSSHSVTAAAYKLQDAGLIARSGPTAWRFPRGKEVQGMQIPATPAGIAALAAIGIHIQQPMTPEELTEWLRPRLDPASDLIESVAHYLGKTEPEMNAIFDAHHGQMA
jgi:hypothetical protein